MKLRKLIKKFEVQESQAIAPRWREIEKPIFLHKRNKWTQSDCLIATDGIATQMVLQHTAMKECPQTSIAFNSKVLQTFGHPCPSDLNPYAWRDLHSKNQLQTFV